MLEKTLESPLNCKEIKPVYPKGNQSWIFIGKTDAEAETPILWPTDGKNWLLGKDPDVGKDWRQEDKGMTKDEMVGWHRWSWVWASSGSWWWTVWPGVLQSMGLQRVRHDWVTERKLFFEYVRPLFNARKLVNFQLCTRDSSLAASNCWFQGPQMGICPIWFWKWDLYPEFRACGSLHASRSVWKQAASGSLKVKIQIDFF